MKILYRPLCINTLFGDIQVLFSKYHLPVLTLCPDISYVMCVTYVHVSSFINNHGSLKSGLHENMYVSASVCLQ